MNLRKAHCRAAFDGMELASVKRAHALGILNRDAARFAPDWIVEQEEAELRSERERSRAEAAQQNSRKHVSLLVQIGLAAIGTLIAVLTFVFSRGGPTP